MRAMHRTLRTCMCKVGTSLGNPPERGATMVEYALIIALTAVICIVAMGALGSTVSSEFSEINSRVAEN